MSASALLTKFGEQVASKELSFLDFFEKIMTSFSYDHVCLINSMIQC